MSDSVRNHRLTFTDDFWTAFTERYPNASEALESLGRRALGMPPRPDVSERGRFKAGENGRTRARKKERGERHLTCPRCKSDETRRTRNYGKPVGDEQWCTTCGHRWEPSAKKEKK